MATIQVRQAYLGKSGRTVAVIFELASNQDITTLTLGTGTCSVSVNGAAAVPCPTIKVFDSYVLIPSIPGQEWAPTSLAPTDAVTISAPSGWVKQSTTNSPTLSNQTCVNYSGVEHLPTSFPVRTMQLGYNGTGFNYFQPIRYIGNIAKHGSHWVTPDGGDTFDANDDIVTMTGTLLTLIGTTVGPFDQNTFEPGTYNLRWDGLGTAQLEKDGVGATATVTFLSEDIGHATNNRRTYAVGATGAMCGGLRIKALTAPLTNIRFHVDGREGETFDRHMLRHIAGAAAFRTMDILDTNNCNVVEMSDYPPVSQRSYFRKSVNAVTASVTSVEHHPNADGYWEPPTNRVYGLMTCSGPHGLTDGQTVTLSDLANVPTTTGDVNFDGDRMIHVENATQFSVFFFRAGGGTIIGSTPQTGTVEVEQQPACPPSLVLDFCIQAGVIPWLNISHTMSDTGIADFAILAADKVGPDRQCYLEYSNECWNFANSFNQSRHCYGRGQLDPAIVAATTNTYYRGNYWYAQRATDVFEIFTAEWQSRGWNVNNLIRVLAGQSGSSVRLTNSLYWAVDVLGRRVDAISIAPYWDSQVSTDDGPMTDAMTIDQLHDITAAESLAPTRLRDRIRTHKALANSYGVRLVGYEAGPSFFASGTNALTLSRQCGKDPRIRVLSKQFWSLMQTEGMDLLCIFTLASVGGVGSIGPAGTPCWGHIENYGQLPGTGDGTDGKFNNAANPNDWWQAVSVQAQAYLEWMSPRRRRRTPGNSITGRRR